MLTQLDESLEVEQQMMNRTGTTEDHVGAVRSFLAKEQPTFTGR